MLDLVRTALWNQFGAAITTLENAIVACPEDLWANCTRKPEYWFLAYHTLYWLDLYLSDKYEGFAQPPQFKFSEMDTEAVLPEVAYTKKDLLEYLAHGRAKFQAKLEALTGETARQRFVFEWMNFTALELMLYNMRHVQHHAAQMNLLLRQEINSAPDWVSGFRNRREWSSPENPPEQVSQEITIHRAGSRPSGRGPENYFTGAVRIDPLIEAPLPARAVGASVTFEPGARTAWHTHPLGQTLIVTSGSGWVQRWGTPRESIRPGDVVWIPPGLKHWHGATATTAMNHIAIQEKQDGKTADWLEQVTDAEYAG